MIGYINNNIENIANVQESPHRQYINRLSLLRIRNRTPEIRICINKTNKNTLITITDGFGNVMKRFSAGMLTLPTSTTKLHGSKRKTRYASELVMRAAITYLKTLRRKRNSYGLVILGRRANVGIKIARYNRQFKRYIRYALKSRLINGEIRPRLPYNGCRLPKAKRK